MSRHLEGVQIKNGDLQSGREGNQFTFDDPSADVSVFVILFDAAYLF